MPGSSPRGKIETIHWKKELPHVKRVLDVGPGWGTYRKLLKDRGEIWEAVEIFEPYIKRFKLESLYDHVYNVSILDFSPKEKYDLVILGDVLEHITKEDAVSTLGKILSYTNYCLISLPLDEETGADLENANDYWHNIHERHLAVWSNASFVETIHSLGAEILALKKYRELSVYIITKKEGLFLNEHIETFHKLHHAYVRSDFGRDVLEVIKYGVIKVMPQPIISFLKKFKL